MKGKNFVYLNNLVSLKLRLNRLLIFIFLISAILFTACGGDSAERSLYVCGLGDRNGDGEINLDDGYSAVYALTINEDEVSYKAISDAKFHHSRVTVAPDGTKLLFQSTRKDLNKDGFISLTDDGQGLYVTDPSGKREVELEYLEDDIFTSILWSRDSSQVAYMTMKNLVWFVSDADGSDQEQIDLKNFTDEESDAFSRWISPDGLLRVWPDLEGGFIVVDISLDQEDALAEPPLTDQFVEYNFISWSPDSTRLLLSVPEDDLSPAESAGPPPNTLYMINADGSGLKRITDRGVAGGLSGYDAVWSPEGEQIAYLSAWTDENGDGFLERGNYRLILINADGSGERELITDELRLGSCLSW